MAADLSKLYLKVGDNYYPVEIDIPADQIKIGEQTLSQYANDLKSKAETANTNANTALNNLSKWNF